MKANYWNSNRFGYCIVFEDLFLHYYESRCIHQLRKSGITRAERFVDVFPVIDDLTAINN